MRNKLVLLIGIAVVLALLAYMFTFQVRYDQVAVLTTFDRAAEPKINPATGELARNADGTLVDPGSLKVQPGLYFKAPWPIQKVYSYSKRVHLLEDRLEEIQTADGYSVIIKTYLAWKIDNPYAFFRTLKNEAAADTQLKSMLSTLQGVISQYNFDQLVNNDPSKLKLREIEQVAAQRLTQQLTRIQPSYGIEVEQVGITRILLPEANTKKVFDRMRSTRERMAETARAEGKSRAATIKARAESAKDRILAFAQRRAQAIRDQGNREAAQYFVEFKKDPQFAVFLRQMEALKEMLKFHTTFILDANQLWFLAPFRDGASPSAQTKQSAQATSQGTAKVAEVK